MDCLFCVYFNVLHHLFDVHCVHCLHSEEDQHDFSVLGVPENSPELILGLELLLRVGHLGWWLYFRIRVLFFLVLKVF